MAGVHSYPLEVHRELGGCCRGPELSPLVPPCPGEGAGRTPCLACPQHVQVGVQLLEGGRESAGSNLPVLQALPLLQGTAVS